MKRNMSIKRALFTFTLSRRTQHGKVYELLRLPGKPTHFVIMTEHPQEDLTRGNDPERNARGRAVR